MVVESPVKAKHLQVMLGSGWHVVSTRGRLFDLPESRLGVLVEEGFKPEWCVVQGKEDVVGELVRAAQHARQFVLATDPDREGEAIAWSVLEVVRGVLPRSCEVKRVLLYELTPQAVERALREPRALDLRLVAAAHARRVLDRLVGYVLSPYVAELVGERSVSVGRVQSYALGLINELQKELRLKGWRVVLRYGLLRSVGAAPAGVVLEVKHAFSSKRAAEKAAGVYLTQPAVIEVRPGQRTRFQPPPPFKTSTFLAEASRRGFSASYAMSLLQRLYERGYLTYVRTDSCRVSEQGELLAKVELKRLFDLDQLVRRQWEEGMWEQGAHECLRPTGLYPFGLSGHERAVYELVRVRFLASFMPDAYAVPVILRARMPDGLLAEGEGLVVEDVVEEGFWRLVGLPESVFSPFVGRMLMQTARIEARPQEVEVVEPERPTEAHVIERMEFQGVGRPGTYAEVVSSLRERGYVSTDDDGGCALTKLGSKVLSVIEKRFPFLLDPEFTAWMEEALDRLAAGKDSYWRVCCAVWNKLATALEPSAMKKGPRKGKSAEAVEESVQRCQRQDEGQQEVRHGL
ncbi:MAG: DNA topoisomerase [Thermofilum sp.]